MHLLVKSVLKIYTIFGYASKENDMNIKCNFCLKTENTIESQINFIINLELQAKKVKMNSENKIPPASLETTVRVLIFDFDKGWDDLCSILEVVIRVKEDNFCWLETSDRILKHLCVRSHFNLCSKNLLGMQDISNHEKLSSVEAAKDLSSMYSLKINELNQSSQAGVHFLQLNSCWKYQFLS